MKNNNKHWWRIALLTVWTIVAITNICYAGTSQKVRPITLKVTDALSKQPLQGVAVHYIVMRGTFRTSTLGVLPPIEPFIHREIVSKLSAYTDVNGEVSFEGVEVYLRNYVVRPRIDKIDSELMFINLDPSEESKRLLSFEGEQNDRYELLFRDLPNLEHVISPNEKYKGYLLTTVNLIDHAHTREQDNASVEFRPEDFSHGDRAYFTIGLRLKSR